MKISKEKLVQIIKEELEALNRQDDEIGELTCELQNLLGRQPAPREIKRIRTAVISGDVPLRDGE